MKSIIAPSTLDANAMFTTSLIITENALQFGSIQTVMYGQLLENYTPTYGPNAGTQIPLNTWVYLVLSESNYDYTACPVSGSVPAFNTYTSAETYNIQLPNVAIASGRIVFFFGTSADIVAVASAPQAISPTTQTGVYDFIEFTYDLTNVIYINTTMIDQFGMPIQIQTAPADKLLPDGAGVIMPRWQVFASYRQFCSGNSFANAYAQCANDAFGNASTLRIVSPKNAALEYGVQGVVVSTTAQVGSLAAGTYYYAITALNGSGVATYAQCDVAQISTPGNIAVNIAWAPNSAQPVGTTQYNVYRGTVSGASVSWSCIANLDASQFPSGCSTTDSGQAEVPGQPNLTFNPLNTSFDSEITTFFTNYQTNTLTLTATDGTDDGYIYTFSGKTVLTTDGSYINYLSLLLTSVVNSNGNPVTNPPIPLQTSFNIYYPFWNTNTYNTNFQSPPSWAPYPYVPASVMVLAAEGVFADSAAQPVPSGADPVKYQNLLGALENQIVSAITRGIANRSGNPQNWGNGTAPTQLAPTIISNTNSTLQAGLYYYLVTVTNTNGETYPSLEFSQQVEQNQSVQISWGPMSASQATTFNVYRGSSSYGENELIAKVTNSDADPATNYQDNGTSISQTSPPMYFPSGVPSNSYDQFFHLSNVSLNGVAYAGPYDDQGGQSSTISTPNPTAVSITLGTQVTLNVSGCDNELYLIAVAADGGMSYQLCHILSGYYNPVGVTVTISEGSYTQPSTQIGLPKGVAANTPYNVSIPSGTYSLMAVGICWGGGGQVVQFSVTSNGSTQNYEYVMPIGEAYPADVFWTNSGDALTTFTV